MYKCKIVNFSANSNIHDQTEDPSSSNALFDQTSKTDQVMEMLDNDEILKSMWPIVKEYSKNMHSQGKGNY